VTALAPVTALAVALCALGGELLHLCRGQNLAQLVLDGLALSVTSGAPRFGGGVVGGSRATGLRLLEDA
jgi:hypothetical protein